MLVPADPDPLAKNQGTVTGATRAPWANCAGFWPGAANRALLSPMPPRRLVLAVALLAGCSFFKELQSADSAEDSGSDSGTASDGSG